MRLETDRLELRSAQATDAPFLLSLYTTPEVLRFLPPFPPWTSELALKSIQARQELEAERGFAPLVVVMKESGKKVGSAGLRPVPGGTEVELLYHYLPSAWNRGIGTEAAIALLDFGLQSAKLESVIALAIPANVGSWRVMEKAGMRFLGEASYFGLDGLRKYGADRNTWHPVDSARVRHSE